MAIPTGTAANRPAVPDTGMIRFNTADGRVEVFDGLQWTGVAGAAAGVSLGDAEDISILQALMFG